MDAEDVVEADAYEALNVPAVTNQVALYQHVPENTPIEDKGVLIIGDMDSEPLATKDGDDEIVTLALAAVIKAEERRPLRELKASVLEILNRRQSTRDGW